MFPDHGNSSEPTKPTINPSFLSMRPSDMFKMMSGLGTSNREEQKFLTLDGAVPESLSRTGTNHGVESPTELRPVIPDWEPVSISSRVIPMKPTTSTLCPKLGPPVKTVIPVPQCKQADYSSYNSAFFLTKTDNKEEPNIRPHSEAVAPAPRYSRSDVSTLDGTLPLNLPAPQYRGIDIFTSNGTFSRKPIDRESGQLLEALPSVPKLKGSEFAALDGMLPWKTSGCPADFKPRYSVKEVKSILQNKVTGTTSKETLAKNIKTGFAVTTTSKNAKEVPSTQKASSMKPTPSTFDDSLQSQMQTIAPASSRGEDISTLAITPPVEAARLGLNINPACSLETTKSTSPSRGGPGYSFTQESRFPVLSKTNTKGGNTKIPSVQILSNDPKIERLKNMTSQRRDYLSYKEVPTVTPTPTALPSVQSAILPAQNGMHRESGHREDPFGKIDPIVKQPVISQMIKLEAITKTRNPPKSLLPTLPNDGESDPDASSSDEDEAKAEEAGPLDDAVLISSKPYVKRITARRRMRQGEFSKWFVRVIRKSNKRLNMSTNAH